MERSRYFFLGAVVASLLVFNGAGALFGGWMLMQQPDGSALGLPLSLLGDGPFRDYFIPGLVLFLVNGLFSFFVLMLLLIKHPKYPILLSLLGLALIGWIAVQILIIHTFSYLQLIFVSIGAMFIWAARMYRKRSR